MPGVKLDGAKRASAEVEMVFVTTGPVEVPGDPLLRPRGRAWCARRRRESRLTHDDRRQQQKPSSPEVLFGVGATSTADAPIDVLLIGHKVTNSSAGRHAVRGEQP